jgi:hypothetical protein
MLGDNHCTGLSKRQDMYKPTSTRSEYVTREDKHCHTAWHRVYESAESSSHPLQNRRLGNSLSGTSWQHAVNTQVNTRVRELTRQPTTSERRQQLGTESSQVHLLLERPKDATQPLSKQYLAQSLQEKRQPFQAIVQRMPAPRSRF